MISPSTDHGPYSGLFSDAESDGVLEAGFLLRPTGIALSAWTRTAVPHEVVGVMAAALWGSLDTMIRTLGGEGPRTVLLDAEDRRILIRRVEPNLTLVLIAPGRTGKRVLKKEAQRIIERAAEIRAAVAPRSPLVEVRL